MNLFLMINCLVVYHEVDHHSPEISVRKIGGLLQSGSAH